MEAGGQIKEAAQQCVEGFIQCLDIPTLKENEWAENRLADMNLWVSGTGACARGRASLQSRLASRPETCDVIANLLRLLHIVISECRTQSQTPESFHSHPDEESPIHSQQEGQGRAFSPWSDDSSSDCQSDDAHDTEIVPVTPLREKMYNIESIQDQLAWIAVAIRRSGKRSRLQKADLRFEASEHQELEGHLVGMLLTLSGRWPQERDASKLSEVQLRLIRCNLKRRNRFLYAQQHSRGLVADSIRRENRTAAPKKVGPAQGEMISGKPDSRPSNDRSKHANSTIVTGTSASKVSEDFTLPQSDRAAPAASSIMSTTIIDLDYPRPPRFKDDAHLFRCPCCCEALPAEMANRNRWRKHIADDLSPYTCILNHCDQPDILFNTKEAWRQHVLKDHSSLTYWICFACGDGSQFNDVNAFVQHTKSFHAATIPPGQIQVLCDLSKKKTPEGIQRCPLCNWPEEEGVEVEKDVLLNHIAKEIHSFSLRALPWADDNGEESDQRIGDSSEKVYEWLIQSSMLENSGTERPWREKKTWHSEYFQQNPYFASSSKASSSSELASNKSREEELEKLRNAGETIVHESSKATELASQVQNTGVDTRPDYHSTMLGPEDYTVGWVCAIAIEYVAAQSFLDEKHESPAYLSSSDTNHYTLGRIGKHNVVISTLPVGEYGPTSAALVSEYMIGSFPNIRIIFMVGIASGVPSQNHDIRLGDVVVGFLEDGRSGVLMYDLENATQTPALKPTGTLRPAPAILSRAISGLRVTYQRNGRQLHNMVYETLEKKPPRLRKHCQRPDLASDRLYRSEIIHPMGDSTTCNLSCGEDLSCLVPRPPRTEDDDDPAIHYGLIASCNRLIKNATIRDKLAAQHDVLCFEMVAAGLMNKFPCLVIRGISDYADTHKNKAWQGYSAMVAAAYAKELLHQIPSLEGEGEAEISEVSMSNMLHGMPSQASMVPQTITPSQAFPTSPMTPPPLSYSDVFDPEESG